MKNKLQQNLEHTLVEIILAEMQKLKIHPKMKSLLQQLASYAYALK